MNSILQADRSQVANSTAARVDTQPKVVIRRMSGKRSISANGQDPVTAHHDRRMPDG
jgi:hypothetical protein